jgi:DNA-binding NarL/FixJ family response regulator
MLREASLPTSGAPKRKPRIDVVVLGYDPLRLVGLRATLEAEPEIHIHEIDIEHVSQSSSSDVVLLGTYELSSVHDTIAMIRGLRPDVRIILTSPANSEESILRAITAGVKGYLDEAAPPEIYKQAIRVVHGGTMWMPRRVMSRFIDRATARPQKSPLEFSTDLSYREKQVLELLVAGRTNKEIGAELGLQERTVKAHITKLMQKAGVENRTALSVHALHNLRP